MHLPDGMLGNSVCVAAAIGSASALGLCAAGVFRQRLRVPAAKAALVGAGAFGVQLLNFPVDHSTSAHLLGSAAAVVLLGPRAAMLAMAAVVSVQCLLLGDGGITPLGVNLLSMAVVAPLAAAGALALGGAQGASLRRAASAGVAAGVVSVLAAALACAAAVGLSGQSGLAHVAPALLVAHLPMALAEGLVTALVLVMARQGVFQSLGTQRAALLAIALLVLVAPLASTLPDSFESAAEELGLTSAAALWSAPLEEYAAAGYGWASLAALVGVLAVAGLAASVQRSSQRAALVAVLQRRRVGE